MPGWRIPGPFDWGSQLVRPRGGLALSLGLTRSLKVLHRANLSPIEIDIVQPSVRNSPAIPPDCRPVAIFEWNSGHCPIPTPFTRLCSIIIHYSSSHEDMAPRRCPFSGKQLLINIDTLSRNRQIADNSRHLTQVTTEELSVTSPKVCAKFMAVGGA